MAKRNGQRNSRSDDACRPAHGPAQHRQRDPAAREGDGEAPGQQRQHADALPRFQRANPGGQGGRPVEHPAADAHVGGGHVGQRAALHLRHVLNGRVKLPRRVDRVGGEAPAGGVVTGRGGGARHRGGSGRGGSEHHLAGRVAEHGVRHPALRVVRDFLRHDLADAVHRLVHVCGGQLALVGAGGAAEPRQVQAVQHLRPPAAVPIPETGGEAAHGIAGGRPALVVVRWRQAPAGPGQQRLPQWAEVARRHGDAPQLVGPAHQAERQDHPGAGLLQFQVEPVAFRAAARDCKELEGSLINQLEQGTRGGKLLPGRHGLPGLAEVHHGGGVRPLVGIARPGGVAGHDEAPQRLARARLVRRDTARGGLHARPGPPFAGLETAHEALAVRRHDEGDLAGAGTLGPLAVQLAPLRRAADLPAIGRV